MQIEYLFYVIVIVLLAAIALQLFFLRAFLSSALRGIPQALRPSRAERQTINVNVGRGLSVSEAPAEAAVAPAESVAAEPEAGQDEDRADSDEARLQREAERSRIAESVPARPRGAAGFSAVKCPACGMENTSFRTECFNCGSRL